MKSQHANVQPLTCGQVLEIQVVTHSLPNYTIHQPVVYGCFEVLMIVYNTEYTAHQTPTQSHTENNTHSNYT